MNEVSVSEAIEMLDGICSVPDIGPDTEFGNLGLDSLMLIEWISMLEDKLDAEVNIKDLDIEYLGTRSISEVMDVLRGLVVRS
jgi:acyl carrier protein